MPARSEPVPSHDGASSRAPRQSVFLIAGIERFGASEKTRHRVRDLSAGGMKVDGAASLRTGSTVVVEVGSLEAVGATVIWVKDDVAGIRFATPIDPERARDRAAIGQGRAPAAMPAAPAPAPATPEAPRPGSVPTSGWIRDLRNPYRRG